MNKKGFTLLELMLSIAISSVIFTGLWKMAKGGALSFLRAHRQAEVIGSGERALRGSGRRNGMLRDIRRSSGANSILADRLSLTGPAGTVEYFREDTNLLLAVAGSTSTVARNITALNFRYFTAQAGLLAQATAPALVDSIEVSLRAESGGAVYELVSAAGLRNR